MATPYAGYVLTRSGRWRADLPGSIAILFAIAFVVGMKPEIHSQLAVFVWGCLGGVAGFGYLWWRGHRSLRWRLTADETGVRLANRKGSSIDLGIPRSVDHGRLVLPLTGAQARRLTPHVWVSLVTADGKTVLFQRAMGALDSVPKHWPEANPPRTADVYSSMEFDPVAFHGAIARPA